jgi:hypothetical protein
MSISGICGNRVKNDRMQVMTVELIAVEKVQDWFLDVCKNKLCATEALLIPVRPSMRYT